MAKRYNVSVHDDLVPLIEKAAKESFCDENSLIRSLLVSHLTGRCQSPLASAVAPMATAAGGANALPPEPKVPPATKELERLKAIQDLPKLEAELVELGIFQKPGEDPVLPGDLHDKRCWMRKLVRNPVTGERDMYNYTLDPKNPDDPKNQFSNSAFQNETEFWSWVLKRLREIKNV